MNTYPYKVEIDLINDLIEPIGETGLSKIIYIDEITISPNGVFVAVAVAGSGNRI
jgi:hypothetical protein